MVVLGSIIVGISVCCLFWQQFSCDTLLRIMCIYILAWVHVCAACSMLVCAWTRHKVNMYAWISLYVCYHTCTCLCVYVCCGHVHVFASCVYSAHTNVCLWANVSIIHTCTCAVESTHTHTCASEIIEIDCTCTCAVKWYTNTFVHDHVDR